MNEEIKGWLKAIIILIIIPSAIVTIVYFLLPQYNDECLSNYAEQYCKSEGYESKKSYSTYTLWKFSCIKQNNRRSDDVVKFNFLEEELVDCRIKERNVFKRIKK